MLLLGAHWCWAGSAGLSVTICLRHTNNNSTIPNCGALPYLCCSQLVDSVFLLLFYVGGERAGGAIWNKWNAL
jgi:hypothetical protein